MLIPSWRRIAATACLLIGIAGATQFKYRFGSADPHSIVRLGQPLPRLPVDNSGAECDLRQIIAGCKSVVVFYSPACRTCEEELPALQPFPEALRLVMVSESNAQGQRNSLLFPGAVSFYDRWGILTRSFAIAALPTILFVDERGILREGLVGTHPRELVQTKLREFASRLY